MSKCVYLASVTLKIEHAEGGQKHDFFFFFSKYIRAKKEAPTRVKTTEIFTFVYQTLLAYTENYINVNSVVFLI